MQETRKFVEQLLAFLIDGKNVGIHCRQGIGRSALIAASLLVLAGLAPDEALQRIQTAAVCQCRKRQRRGTGLLALP